MEKKQNSKMLMEQLDKNRKITCENRQKLSKQKQQKIDENEKKIYYIQNCIYLQKVKKSWILNKIWLDLLDLKET